jgi:hypothetical protein
MAAAALVYDYVAPYGIVWLIAVFVWSLSTPIPPLFAPPLD